MPCYHILVKGKVQGVFFRQTAKEVAREKGLKGWIKNTSYGAVEAKVCGDEDSLQEFVEWVKKGPELARVDEMQVDFTSDEKFDDFTILKTLY